MLSGLSAGLTQPKAEKLGPQPGSSHFAREPGNGQECPEPEQRERSQRGKAEAV